MSAFTSPYLSNYQQILLRGGRLGKIGKRAASYAPVLGLVGAAALFGASPAQAANECTAGVTPTANAIINCNAATYNPVGGDIIYTNLVGPTVNVTGGINVVGTGVSVSVGASAASAGPAALVIDNAGGILTGGNGVLASHAGTGGSALTLVNGTVVTTGGNGIGLSSVSTGAGLASVLVQGGSVQTSGNGGGGIVANSAGGAIVTVDGGTIAASGAASSRAVSVNVTNSASGEQAQAIINAGSISAVGSNSVGVRVSTVGSGGAAVTMNGGSVVTTGSGQSWGLEAHSTGIGGTLITMNGGSVSSPTVTLRSWNRGSTGDASVLISGGNISSDRDSPAESRNENGSGNAILTVTGGVISTPSYALTAWNRAQSGASIVLIDGDAVINGRGGAQAYASNLGERIVTMNAGTINLVTGVNGGGLVGFTDNVDNDANTTVVLNGGLINGANANGSTGLTAQSVFGDSIIRMTNGEVIMGVNSQGIQVIPNDGTFLIDMTGGSIFVGAGTSRGIASYAYTSGIINIGSAATVNASAFGIAIRDGDANRDGVDELAGTVVVTTAGTVTGSAILGLGDDEFNLVGGDFDGDIYGDDVVASDFDGNDTFNWTGGNWYSSFFGGNGSDAANISAASYDGTHHVLDGGDDTGTVDGWIDVLTFNGVTSTVNAGGIVNWEVVNLDASSLTYAGGAWEVGDSTSTSGVFLANSSVLNGANSLALTGNLSIDASSQFEGFGAGAGVYAISGDVINSGIMTTGDGAVGDVITINSNYVGGGALIFDTVLGDDTSLSDMLVVDGTTSGTTNVFINNVGGTGAQTNTGILVVDVGDTANSTGVFLLANGDYILEQTGEVAIIAGAYGYALRDVAGDWYLQSEFVDQTPIWQPASPTYEVYGSTLLGLARLPSLQDRVGNRHWAGEEGAFAESAFVFCKDPAQNFSCAVTPEQAQVYAGVPLVGTTIEGQGAWVRVDGARTKYDPVSTTTGASYDARLAGLQVGYDHVLRETDAGDRLIGGVNLSYRTSNADVTAATGASTIDTTGIGLGGSLTWYQKNGLYVDAQAQVMSFKSDLSAGALGTFADGHKVMGHALSLEMGKEIKLNESWSITPQAQLSYAKVKEDGYVDANGVNVSFAAESLQLRLGVEAAQETSWKADDETTSRRSLRAGVHVVKEFHPETVVNVSGTTLRSEGDDVTGEITLGGSYNWSDDKYSVYGTVGAGTGLNTFGDSTRMRGTVGMRLRWQ